MKKYLLTIVILLIYFGSIYSDTIIVDCNGGGHYLTIQEGIDAAQDNDTVLVYQGIYHETIVIDGKDIVVGSLYYTTQDTSYISQTVIKGDGSSPYSIVELQNTISTIIGFTILGPEPQTGILSHECTPSIEHNIIQNTEIGIRVKFECPYIDSNSIYNNDLGIQISLVSAPKALGVFNNIIHDNVKGIECSDSSPLIINNIIYNNLQYGISCNWFDTPEIFNNVIYDNNVGIQIIFHSEPNIYDNTISLNHTGILAYSNTYAHISNSIIYGNDFNLSEYEPGILTEIYIAYSCIGDGVPNWCIDEGGNISEDPYFVDPDNGEYTLQWNTTNFSPCIDTGDPDTEWDADNTPPDMGAITAISHDYFYNQYDGGVIDQIEWISFPALNRITDNYTEALGLLNRQELLNFNTTQSDDILDHVVFEGGYVIEFYSGEWHNILGDFDSKQGYKIVLQEGYTSAEIGISGTWEDESEPVQLYANKANWVGCYLEVPASLEDAFESIWDEWISITSEHWAIFREWEDEEIRGRCTVNPGELYIIRVQNDCELIWNESSPPVPPYRKEMTDYFSYEEKLDYMPILVDTVYGDTTVAEIGVFDGDECIGATKVTDGYPVQILAYTPESGSKDGGNGLQFMLYYGSSKNKAKVVTNYTVFNRETSAFVIKPVYYDRDDFVRVRLNTEGYQPEYEFALMNNYPNPVHNGLTNISFALSKDDKNTEIQIFNIKGQLVRKLDCNEVACKNGKYTISWDCRNENGIKVSSGIYFYKLISDNKTAIKKMLVIR